MKSTSINVGCSALFKFLFLLVGMLAVFSCSNQIENTKLESPRGVSLPENVKGGNNNRLGIGIYYNVSNQWAAAQWTFKGDFNGDGLWDIASLNGTQAYVKLSQGESASSYLSQTWLTDGQFSSEAGYTWAADFNGDGYTDIASAVGGTVYMKINNHNGGFNFGSWTVSNQWGLPGYTVTGDFNHDGKADIASCSGTNVYLKLSTGSAFQNLTWTTDGSFGPSGSTYGTDYNGDGYTDIVSINGTQIYIKQSTGSGFSNLTHNTTNNWGAQAYTWQGDTNNNGKGEIITAIGSAIIVREWTGSSTWGQVTNNTQNLWGSAGGSGFTNYSYNFVENFNGIDGDDVVSIIGSQIFVH